MKQLRGLYVQTFFTFRTISYIVFFLRPHVKYDHHWAGSQESHTCARQILVSCIPIFIKIRELFQLLMLDPKACTAILRIYCLPKTVCWKVEEAKFLINSSPAVQSHGNTNQKPAAYVLPVVWETKLHALQKHQKTAELLFPTFYSSGFRTGNGRRSILNGMIASILDLICKYYFNLSVSLSISVLNIKTFTRETFMQKHGTAILVIP